ncbi:MAG: GNAT family N-acetyltransferase [Fimbriimonas sp.]
MTVEIVEVNENPGDARLLFREYEKELAVDLCFQSFEEELANLPGKYARPDGCLWVARVDGELAGCVAVRLMEPGVAELKRLYVRPGFRSTGLGRRLAVRAEEFAREAGYQWLKLDTLTRLVPALKLYESLGYTEWKPVPGDGAVATAPSDLEIVYFEKRLQS